MTSMVEGTTPEPRILIAEGPWTMKENYLHQGSLVEDVLGYDIVVHKCPWKNNWFLKLHNFPVFMILSDDPFCMKCNENVPNMFQTLWTLKNLDKIQNSASYGKGIWGPSAFYLTSIMNIMPGQVLQYNPKGEMTFYVQTLPKP